MDSGVLLRPAHYPDVVRAIRIQVRRCTEFPKFQFPRTRGASGMKTTVLAMVLACALAANAQQANQTQTQPAPPSGGQQPAATGGGQSQAAPEIKDPAEYNAYVGAI